uniref:Uncharacterized protein n=1 Tax=viral metagenome TaxID=1070528 RepID=A0A6C0DSA1_9ZZZZ
MYFNLKDLPDATTGTRSTEFYLKAARGTLALDSPMVVFCDITTRPWIQSLRDELIGPNEKTIYVERPLVEYDFYKINWPIANDNWIRHKWPIEGRCTASYYLTCMFKIHALKIAQERSDFKATHYFWVDFGCSHVAYSKTFHADALRMLGSPRSKVTVQMIRYWDRGERENLFESVKAGTCGLACTVFSVEKTYIARLYTLMLAVFYELLFKGIGHTDEQVMSVAYYRDPEMFNLYYGDYYSVISNYHHIVHDWHSVIYYIIERSSKDGNLIFADRTAKELVESVNGDHTDLSDKDLTLIKSLLPSLEKFLPARVRDAGHHFG